MYLLKTFERLLCSKRRNYSQNFSLEIFFWYLFYLESLIIGVVFIVVLLVWTYPYFFLSFLFLLYFFFYRHFPWQRLTIQRIAGKGEGIIIFLVFHFHPLKNIHLVYRYFYHLFLINLLVITRLVAGETCSS